MTKKTTQLVSLEYQSNRNWLRTQLCLIAPCVLFHRCEVWSNWSIIILDPRLTGCRHIFFIRRKALYFVSTANVSFKKFYFVDAFAPWFHFVSFSNTELWNQSHYCWPYCIHIKLKLFVSPNKIGSYNMVNRSTSTFNFILKFDVKVVCIIT